jgi:succinate-semialdehyde dehydrogenase/glutarate-semialdehyde dehydrogenase/succinyl-CoA reductase
MVEKMKIQSINPATEEVIGEFEVSDKKTVSKAVKKARVAFNEWKKTDVSEREQIIKNFAEVLRKNKSEVAELISKEMGKPIIESESEVEGSFGNIDWFVSNTKKVIQDEIIELNVENVTAKIRFEPVGVVGIITPWNFPIDTPLWKIVPALLTGNTIVFKPSEYSTLCGMKIEELLKEAGIPEGVFNLVVGNGTTGKYLVASKVNMISFTGSSKVGKEVMSRAGKKLKKTVLELGGSDPFIVFEDAIFEQAVNAAVFGRFLNCGQVCTAAKRIFVDKKIYDSFLEGFVEKVKKLKIGDPLDRNTEIGPIVSKKQLETLEKQVKDAIDKGAKVLCGGKRIEGKGYFYEPTVLTNIKKNMLVLNEEVFGPVASILPFKSIKEAIKLANDTNYGLGASVWTQNKKIAEEMIKSVESGMVWINDFGTPYPQCPQGGIKDSGMGRELSKYGILEFCNLKTVVISEDKTVKKPWWFPYNE